MRWAIVVTLSSALVCACHVREQAPMISRAQALASLANSCHARAAWDPSALSVNGSKPTVFYRCDCMAEEMGRDASDTDLRIIAHLESLRSELLSVSDGDYSNDSHWQQLIDREYELLQEVSDVNHRGRIFNTMESAYRRCSTGAVHD